MDIHSTILVSIMFLCIAAVLFARTKYGGVTERNLAVEEVKSLSARLAKIENDKLRDRINRLENNAGLDIFR